jgi:hypothetical protein
LVNKIFGLIGRLFLFCRFGSLRAGFIFAGFRVGSTILGGLSRIVILAFGSVTWFLRTLTWPLFLLRLLRVTIGLLLIRRRGCWFFRLSFPGLTLLPVLLFRPFLSCLRGTLTVCSAFLLVSHLLRPILSFFCRLFGSGSSCATPLSLLGGFVFFGLLLGRRVSGGLGGGFVLWFSRLLRGCWCCSGSPFALHSLMAKCNGRVSLKFVVLINY